MDLPTTGGGESERLMGIGRGPPRRPSRWSKRVTSTLYLSHFLSTWGIRMSEYSCVLFLAASFSGTLFYVSVYGLIKSLVTVLLSSWVGAYLDRINRLKSIRLSIVLQRIPMAISCIFFIHLPRWKDSSTTSGTVFLIIVLLSCVEKLASIANIVAIERDWVIIIAEAHDLRRQDLNATMRRIDLCSKLVAPFFVSLLITVSTMFAMWVVMNMTAVLIVMEFIAITRLYASVPELAERTMPTKQVAGERELHIAAEPSNSGASARTRIVLWTLRAITPWREYVRSPVFLPSLSNAILYLTVLSFGGQMVTYLLSTGFVPLEIGVMRIASVLAELAGTWAAPIMMRKLGPVRAGLWFIMWQVACIAAFAGTIIRFDAGTKIVGICLIVGVTFKRLGLWGSDLSIQFIVQEAAPSSSRARFSATEMASQNFFEVLSSSSTAVFAQPDQFKYPVLISYAAIVASAFCYVCFVRKVRGHLLHSPGLCLNTSGRV